jgi:hypothetical protein
MVGMNQMVNQQTRGGLRLSFDIFKVKGKLRYNLKGKTKTKQPKKSDVPIVVRRPDESQEERRGTA